MTIHAGTVLYASDDSDVSITDAREYIRRHGLTQDDVRLLRKDGSVMVVVKRVVALINRDQITKERT
jgi:hypothetical protein